MYNIFTSANIGHLYLSPYVSYKLKKDKTIFFHYIINKYIIVNCEFKYMVALIESLKKGISYDKLVEIILPSQSDIDSRKVIANLMKEGIIE